MEWWNHFRSAVAGVIATVVLAGLTGCASKLETNRKEGMQLYAAQNYDASLAAFKRALVEDQFDAVSNAHAGLIQYRADNLQQAEYHLRLALNADPSSEAAKEGLTATLVKQGKPDEALDALERSAKMAESVEDPRWLKSNYKVPYTHQVEERLFLGKVDDRVRIARAYESLGDYDNAYAYYVKALEKDPGSAAIMLSIANLAERARNPARTREFLGKAYLTNPRTPGLTEAMTRNGVAISEVIDSRR